jgi:Zn-dependent peptidase ImmA (M78 family)/DNA-binding XRE family transcriptional regulator
MSFVVENIFGTRLKLARKMAGMSLQDLADELTNKVTKQALSKYEMGQMKPNTEVLAAISQALRMPPDYFIKSPQVNLGAISFRKKASLSKKDEEALVEKGRHYIERCIEIESILAVESEFVNPLADMAISDKKGAEQAASKLREVWELGNEPIPILVETLEMRGVKVLLIEASDDIDGFAVYTSNGVPLVVINIKDRSVERIRFTIIHELAHLLLKFNEDKQFPEKEIEILCHCFASCFILPTKMLLKIMGGGKRNYIYINELISIKESYGISIRAIVHRLKELEVITPSYYQRWVIYMSKTYGAKEEPGTYAGAEKSKLFNRLINRALAEELISLSKAATLCNVSVNELRKGNIGVNQN